MTMLGSLNHPKDYNGRADVHRLLLSLQRLAEGGRKLKARVPGFEPLAVSAQGSHDAVQTALRELLRAEAALKAALIECKRVYEAEVEMHRRYAGHAYAIVGADAESLNELGLRLKPKPPARRHRAVAQEPAPTTPAAVVPME
jgi:hypothetical protein